MPGLNSNNSSTTTSQLSLEGRDHMATFHLNNHLAVTPHSMSCKSGSSLQESQHFNNDSSFRDGSQMRKRNLIILLITLKMKTIEIFKS